jgi:putative SOS response-associated peptidase YedK
VPGLVSFAGLLEAWHDPGAETVETCTILTAEANELMRPLHDRMPVILGPEAEPVWLDPHAGIDALHALLVPYPDEKVKDFPVGRWVSLGCEPPRYPLLQCLGRPQPRREDGVAGRRTRKEG